MATLSTLLSRAVKKRRNQMGLSRAELAKRAGVHNTYIGMLERDERTPSVDVAEAVANGLGTTLEKLISQARPKKNQ